MLKCWWFDAVALWKDSLWEKLDKNMEKFQPATSCWDKAACIDQPRGIWSSRATSTITNAKPEMDMKAVCLASCRHRFKWQIHSILTQGFVPKFKIHPTMNVWMKIHWIMNIGSQFLLHYPPVLWIWHAWRVWFVTSVKSKHGHCENIYSVSVY